MLITQYRHYRVTSALTGSTAWRDSDDSPNTRDTRNSNVRQQVNKQTHEQANLTTTIQTNLQTNRTKQLK